MDVETTCIATGSTGNAYLLKVGETVILLDAGVSIDVIRRANHYKLNNITAALITHAHKDHCLAVADLLKNCIRVYCHEQIGVGVIPEEYKNTVYYFGGDRQLFYINKNTRVSFTEQNHDSHCVGYDISTPNCLIHYVTDTNEINYKQILSDRDSKKIPELWICECDYTSLAMEYTDNTESAQVIQRNNRTRATHLSDAAACNFFTPANADAILFVHQSRLNFDITEFRKKFKNNISFEIAQPGKTYLFNSEKRMLEVIK